MYRTMLFQPCWSRLRRLTVAAAIAGAIAAAALPPARADDSSAAKKQATATAAAASKTSEQSAAPTSPVQANSATERPDTLKQKAKRDPYAWRPLFNGKSLDGWEAADMGIKGTIEVREGQIVIKPGGIMAGILYAEETPTSNYELVVEGMRLSGNDFFCATTFPVGDSYCTLVPGGWSGNISGLSTIDGHDASENLTTCTLPLNDKQWYKFRIRVTDEWIEGFCDDKRFVLQPRDEHRFDVRAECLPCAPLGIATYRSVGAVRSVQFRELKPDEVRKIAKENIKAMAEQ